MNVVGQMWMRGEQLKSSPLSFFSPNPEGERGDGDCVWHEKEEKKKSISSQSEKPILKAE